MKIHLLKQGTTARQPILSYNCGKTGHLLKGNLVVDGD